MSDGLPPYRFQWRDYAPQILFGNLAAIAAIAIFAALEMLPFWIIIIPAAIHLLIFMAAWRDQVRKQRGHDK